MWLVHRPLPKGQWAVFFRERIFIKEFPKGGLIGKTAHTIRGILALNIPLYAAGASFYVILSVFPALVLLLSLLRYTDLSVDSLIRTLGGVIPEALMERSRELIRQVYDHSTGALVGLSAVTALWSAGKGIYGLMKGLNAVYAAREDRGYFRIRLISMGYTFVFLLMLLLTLAVHVFGDIFLGWLRYGSGPAVRLLLRAVDLRFVLLLAVQTVIFTLMYTVLPNRRSGFRESFPGAMLASLGWLVFSDAYSVYVTHFSGFANVYGSVYAVALAMLWLYCCVSIVFYGGGLNRYLAGKRKEKM